MQRGVAAKPQTSQWSPKPSQQRLLLPLLLYIQLEDFEAGLGSVLTEDSKIDNRLPLIQDAP